MSKFLGLDCFVNRTNESHGSGHNYPVLLVISCATLSRIVIRLRRGLVGSAAGNIPHPERVIGNGLQAVAAEPSASENSCAIVNGISGGDCYGRQGEN